MMEKISWKVKSFEELSLQELYKILKSRTEVFVVEQECAYLEVDGRDEQCLHLWAEDEKGSVLAYCRLLPAGLSYPEVSIGRVLVNEANRGSGLARLLISKALTTIQENCHTTEIRIEAQYYLRKFYSSFGFVEDSEPFLEDGIKHIEMLLK